jgi:hypothetical protein
MSEDNEERSEQRASTGANSTVLEDRISGYGKREKVEHPEAYSRSTAGANHKLDIALYSSMI